MHSGVLEALLYIADCISCSARHLWKSQCMREFEVFEASATLVLGSAG